MIVSSRWTRILLSAQLRLTLLALPIVMLLACREPDPSEPVSGSVNDARIFLVGGDAADPAWQAVVSGAKSQAADVDITGLQIRSRTIGQAATPAEFVTAARAEGANVIGLWVEDPATPNIDPVKLRDAGVELITLNAPLDARPTIHIGVDYPDAAGQLARMLPKLTPDAASYVLIHNAAAHTRAASVLSRFEQSAPAPLTAGSDPRFVRLGQYDLATHDGPPQTLLRDVLTDYPSVRLIVTLDPAVWLEPIPPVTLAETQHFVTLGSAQPLWNYLRNGRARALVGPLHGEIGRRFLKIALAAASMDESPPRYNHVACEVVTPDKLVDFSTRYLKAAGLPGGTLEQWQRGTGE